MRAILKFILIVIPALVIASVGTGLIFDVIGSKIIPLTTPIDGSFGLGYAGDLIWLFFLGGFVGLIPGILVSKKIWQKIK